MKARLSGGFWWHAAAGMVAGMTIWFVGQAVGTADWGGGDVRGDVTLPLMTPPGDELIMFVAVSPECGFSRDPRLPTLLASIQSQLRAIANSAGYTFASVGYADASDPGTGVRFLETVGAFDELSSGREWRNSTLLRISDAGWDIDRAFPQVVVLRQPALERDGARTGVGDRNLEVLGAFEGIPEIELLADPHYAAAIVALDGVSLNMAHRPSDGARYGGG